MSQRNLRYLQATVMLAAAALAADVSGVVSALVIAGCLALNGRLSPPWIKA